MRRLHLGLGLVGLVVFVTTGAYMRINIDMPALDTGSRFLLRSRHIYILFGALVNLSLGMHWSTREVTWRRWLQAIGSVVVMAALVSLCAAFPLEAVAGKFSEDWARLGIFGTAVGVVCHLVAHFGRRD